MKKIGVCLAGIALITASFIHADELKGKSVDINNKVRVTNTALGIGGHGSFVLTSTPMVPAIGWGIEFLIELSITQKFIVQLDPNLTFWVTGRDVASDWWDEYHQRWGQIGINLFDIKVFLPIGKEKPVQPYGGLGPALIINTYSYYMHHIADVNGLDAVDQDSWGDLTGAFNFFAGVDFKAGKRIYPYLEARMVATGIWNFRFTGGFNVMF